MRWSLKRAAPSITRTPSPVKRSLESFGAIAAITLVHVIVHVGEVDLGGADADDAERRAPAMRARALAAAISAFDGTQPELRQSPPILPFSISTTGTPNAAAAAATERPPEPAPITQMSV